MGEHLVQAGLRAEVDERGEKLGFKIREAQVQKIPYMLVVGAREEESGTASVRSRSGGDLGAMAARPLSGSLPGEGRRTEPGSRSDL